METNTTSSDALIQRFFDNLIGVNPEAKRINYSTRNMQQNAGRTLLDVETQARLARQADVKAKAQYAEFAQAHLHDEVAEELLKKLHSIKQVEASLFDTGAEFYALIDVLSAKAVTVNKLDPLISKISWLTEDILRLVNQPQYRSRTASGSMIKDIKTALRFLGVETLQQIVPVYAMRRMLPHSTEPFTGLKTRIWDYSLAVAIAARRLAENSAENTYAAFCAGLFHSLGHIVVTRNYLRTYQQVRQQQMLHARSLRDNVLTQTLDELEPDASFLSDSWREFAAVLSADITSRWQLQLQPLCQTLDQMAEGLGFGGCSPLAKIVQQAQTYVQWQTLKRQQRITDAESIHWLTEVQLNNESMAALAATNLTKLGVDI